MMLSDSLPTLGAALLALSAVVHAAGSTHESPMRTLKAVRSVSAINSRDIASLAPRNDFHLDYSHDGSAMAATLHVGTVVPTIVLEELDGLLSGIHCSAEGLSLSFAAEEYATAAKSAWAHPRLVVITSHTGCNNHGERVPYLVSGKSFSDKSVHLTGAPISWGKITERMSLDFETRQTELPKRDNPSQGGSHDISWSFIDQTIWYAGGIEQICKNCSGSATVSILAGNIDIIAEFTGIENDVLQVAKAVGVEVASLGGLVASKVESEIAKVTSVLAPIITPVESVAKEIPSVVESALNPIETTVQGLNPFKSGGIFGGLKSRDTAADVFKAVASDLNIQVGIDNLQATFDFETTVQLDTEFMFHLLGFTGLALPGFEIPDVIRVGPSIDPTIIVQFEMQEPVTFDYGFDMSLPTSAVLDLDFIDPTNSSAKGFDQLKVNHSPVKLISDSAAANFSVSFRPIVEFGLWALTLEVDPVIAFVDLPQVNGSIALLKGVDDSCQPTNGGSDHIYYEHSLEVDVGIGADLSAFYVVQVNPQITLASLTNLFPFTTCINYGAKTAAPSAGTGLPYSSASGGLPGPFANATGAPYPSVTGGTATTAGSSAKGGPIRTGGIRHPLPIGTELPIKKVSDNTTTSSSASHSHKTSQISTITTARGLPHAAPTGTATPVTTHPPKHDATSTITSTSSTTTDSVDKRSPPTQGSEGGEVVPIGENNGSTGNEQNEYQIEFPAFLNSFSGLISMADALETRLEAGEDVEVSMTGTRTRIATVPGGPVESAMP